MAQPTAYNRVTSFTNYQAVNPTTPLPAASVDAEFNAVKITLDQIAQNLALIQRDDGELANASVGNDQLSTEVTTGTETPTVWLTATAYSVGNVAFHGAGYYRCKVAHTSGTFATDLAAVKWELINDLSTIPLVNASQIAVTPTGNISSTTVQAALAELDSEKAALSHSHIAAAISDSSAVGRSVLTAATAAAALAALGIANSAPNYGELRQTTAIVAPSQWAFCYGQAVSRTTYAAAFAAMTISQSGVRTSGSPIITGLSDTSDMRAGYATSGTGVPVSTSIQSVDSATQVTLTNNATSTGTATLVVAPHGVGDGSTTFNVPDYRGRVLAGRDDMGGSAASRLTTGYFGNSGARIGAAGGAESHTLLQANLPAVTLATTVADHDHDLGDGYDAQGTFSSGPDNAAHSVIDVVNATGSGRTGTKTGLTGTTPLGGSGSAHNNTQPTAIVNTIIYLGA